MALIIDPDLLIDGTEITITVATKLITLTVTGNLSTDGTTIKCVYSKLKELWKSNTTYIKYPFPMGPITDEQFEMINGWDWAGNSTRYLLRTGGWAKKDANGISEQEWTGVITLGSIGASDQAYFWQTASGSATTNFELTGPVNQAISVYSSAGSYDYRGYLQVACRIYAKSYALSTLSDIGVSTLTYQAYRFPLANATDIKVTTTDANIIGNTPFFGTLSFSGTDGSVTLNDPTFTITTSSFSASHVGQYVGIDTGSNVGFYRIGTFTDSNNVDVDRNFPATQATITFTVAPSGMGILYYNNPQQRSIGGTNYNFSAIIAGNQGTAEQIYTYIQYQLRQTYDIDAASGTAYGKRTGGFSQFVGDTLYTLQSIPGTGTFIDNYQSSDINRLVFKDNTGTNRTFPYTANVTINFGDNLKADTSSKYWIFFTDIPSGNYGDSDAILVNTADTVGSSGRARSGTTATITAAAAHTLVVNDGIEITGLGDSQLNGVWVVATIPTSVVFTFTTTTTATCAYAGDTGGTITEQMANLVGGASSVQKTFAYDTNTQGGRTSGADAPITAIALGLSGAQFVKTTGTLVRSTANSVSLVSALERNYQNPA